MCMTVVACSVRKLITPEGFILYLFLQDLRNANSALANELARTRSACQEVIVPA